MMGAECAPALDARLKAALANFAAAIGLAFQIQDDLLDVIGETAVLGKTAGADQALAKPTYPAVAGVAAARLAVTALHQRALEALEPFGERAEPLRLLSDWLLARRN
jgi:geranylgeranyl pyrophosphate synthase